MNFFRRLCRKGKKQADMYLRSSIIRVPPEQRKIIYRWRGV